MESANSFIEKKINERIENGLFRTLNHYHHLIDFCSNDYLGFARDAELSEQISNEIDENKLHKNGSTGSRLITGNHPYTEQAESFIANFHQTEAALLFNSGYNANVGLLACLPQRNDTIIADELVHASIIDGMRLSYAERLRFKHNNLPDLEDKLTTAKDLKYVVVESVYSMDGDMAPIADICALCEKHNAHLIVDEAHAIGVFGHQGEGLVHQLNLTNRVFATIVTYGKAMGTHGAAILGSKLLKNYLINFARPFIYTTALPLHTVAAIKMAYQKLKTSDHQHLLKEKIGLYNQLMKEKNIHCIKSESAIQTVLFKNHTDAVNKAQYLQKNGLGIKAILAPTVAAGSERIRICLHSFNTPQEIADLITHLSTT